MERVKRVVGYGASKLREQDVFGVPVTLNYRGEQTYKSLCGGAVTVAVFVFLFI